MVLAWALFCIGIGLLFHARASWLQTKSWIDERQKHFDPKNYTWRSEPMPGEHD